jgi:hypothetical protein
LLLKNTPAVGGVAVKQPTVDSYWKTIGFTRVGIGRVLLGEQALSTALAILAGLRMGYGIAWPWPRPHHPDLLRLPFVVSREPYASAAGVMALAALLSGFGRGTEVAAYGCDRAVMKTSE